MCVNVAIGVSEGLLDKLKGSRDPSVGQKRAEEFAKIIVDYFSGLVPVPGKTMSARDFENGMISACVDRAAEVLPFGFKTKKKLSAQERLSMLTRKVGNKDLAQKRVCCIAPVLVPDTSAKRHGTFGRKKHISASVDKLGFSAAHLTKLPSANIWIKPVPNKFNPLHISLQDMQRSSLVVEEIEMDNAASFSDLRGEILSKKSLSFLGRYTICFKEVGEKRATTLST